jgi:hypothetical protein
MSREDDKELLVARVSCVNAPWISPHNRGKRDAQITLHNNGSYLWSENGDTVGWAHVYSKTDSRMTDLFYVPQRFVGQDLIADNLYLLKYVCPVSGKTVQQEINELTAKMRHPAARAGGFVLGHVARFFVDESISTVLRVIRNTVHSGYHEARTGRLFFDAPIRREHLYVATVGELRRAGHQLDRVD